MTLREARPDDLLRIAEIHVACWKHSYRGIIADSILDALDPGERLAHWQAWWQGPGVHLWVGIRDGEVSAFCRFCPARELGETPQGFAEVTHIYVAPAHARSGLGSALFARALETAHSQRYAGLLLWVLERNKAARSFYEGHGLRPDGATHEEPRWLGPGVAEVRYAIRFEEASETGGHGR